MSLSMSACRLSPCSYELSAVLQRIAGEQAATQTGGVIFLLDGSGSVSQGKPQLLPQLRALVNIDQLVGDCR